MDYFEQEQYRTNLARKNRLTKLKSTYSRTRQELPNTNTSKFWSKKLKESGEFPMSKDRTKTVFNNLQNSRGKLLEIGFGRGELLQKLQSNKNISLFGIDISTFSVNSVRKKVMGLFKKSETTKIPFKSSFFDIVVMLEVLEHIPISKNQIALKEIHRVLKKGGVLVVSVPLNEGLENMISKGKNPNAHLRIYTPPLIKAELKLAGFRINKSIFFYAFNYFYHLKSFIAKLFPGLRRPNNILVFAEKI